VCDDGIECSYGEVCIAGVCGGGIPVPPPAAIDDSVRVDKSPANATITWTDPPGAYNVYRGSRAADAAFGYNQTCLSTNVSGNETQDTDTPLPNELFYYLVTRVDACGESSLGTDSEGTERPNDSACAARAD
jgi:hypothetical protein